MINCTGPESNLRKRKLPLLLSLLENGYIQTDQLGLGIVCTFNGATINTKGKVNYSLHCIGSLRKAALWESTAVREIREQAQTLAQSIQL